MDNQENPTSPGVIPESIRPGLSEQTAQELEAVKARKGSPKGSSPKDWAVGLKPYQPE